MVSLSSVRFAQQSDGTRGPGIHPGSPPCRMPRLTQLRLDPRRQPLYSRTSTAPPMRAGDSKASSSRWIPPRGCRKTPIDLRSSAAEPPSPRTAPGNSEALMPTPDPVAGQIIGCCWFAGSDRSSTARKRAPGSPGKCHGNTCHRWICADQAPRACPS